MTNFNFNDFQANSDGAQTVNDARINNDGDCAYVERGTWSGEMVDVFYAVTPEWDEILADGGDLDWESLAVRVEIVETGKEILL